MSSTSSSSPVLILATHNQGKLSEFRDILAPLMPHLPADAIVCASDFDVPEPVEDGITFSDNAVIKAQCVAQATGIPAVADDSGLCVDVLGGAPGIFSARWCGAHGDDAANLHLLLNQISDVPDEHRGARFTCAAALVVPGSQPVVIERSMEGRLIRQPLGTQGFGYDPIFVPCEEDGPQGQHRTTAQLSAEEKNAISHRGKALRDLAPIIASTLGLNRLE